jgi:hypothetical protein
MSKAKLLPADKYCCIEPDLPLAGICQLGILLLEYAYGICQVLHGNMLGQYKHWKRMTVLQFTISFSTIYLKIGAETAAEAVAETLAELNKAKNLLFKPIGDSKLIPTLKRVNKTFTRLPPGIMSRTPAQFLVFVII